MVINSNVGARTLQEYLSMNKDYIIPKDHPTPTIEEEFTLPEYESFRLAFKHKLNKNDEREKIVQYAHLMNHIVDFYSIEKDGKVNEVGYGSMVFNMPSGLVAVVTTPFDNEVLVASKYLYLGK